MARAKRSRHKAKGNVRDTSSDPLGHIPLSVLREARCGALFELTAVRHGAPWRARTPTDHQCALSTAARPPPRPHAATTRRPRNT
eukprot:2823327-Prymnesium_polylepis.1